MELLIGGSIRVAVIVACALAALRVLRGRSAAVRHWVLAMALLCAAAAPALNGVLPSWRIGLVSPRNVAVEGGGAEALAFAPAAPRTATAAMERAPRAAPPAPAVPLNPSLVVLAIWGLGLAACLAVLVAGSARLKWLASRATPVTSGYWVEIAAETLGRTGVRRSVTLLQSAHPALLVTWGVLRPRIMLPAGAASWGDDRIRIVLAHEIAHVQRADWATQLGAEVLRSVFWFNPLLWIACRRLRQESEQACDDAVLRSGVEGAEYAWHLLHLARLFRHRAGWLPAPAMARVSALEQRVGAMLDVRVNRQPITRGAGALAAVLLTGLTLIVGSAGVRAAGTGSIAGLVSSPDGIPVRDAVLYVTHTAFGTQQRVRTDERGHFEARELTPGRYRITSATAGIRWFEVAVRADDVIERTILLSVPAISHTLTVTGPPEPRLASHDMALYFREPFPNMKATPEERRDFDDWRESQPVRAAVALRQPMPVFPPAMRDAGRDGVVVVSARLTTGGVLANVQASGPAEFAQATRDALAQWQWEPAQMGDVPIEVPFDMTVHFRVR